MSDVVHHMWCIRFPEVIEGSCPECERLKLTYPATGNLDYEAMIETYFSKIEE